jgi:hypothetical protein
MVAFKPAFRRWRNSDYGWDTGFVGRGLSVFLSPFITHKMKDNGCRDGFEDNLMAV